MPDPIPHVPEPGDESKDEFIPAVDSSELEGVTVDLQPTPESMKQYLLSKGKIDCLKLTALPGSIITKAPEGRVKKRVYASDELSLGHTDKETNDLPKAEFDEIVTKYYNTIREAAKEINDSGLGTYEPNRLEGLDTAFITLVASYDLANEIVPTSYYEQMDYIHSRRQPWSITQDPEYFTNLKRNSVKK
jgi:hypothetical protein